MDKDDSQIVDLKSDNMSSLSSLPKTSWFKKARAFLFLHRRTLLRTAQGGFLGAGAPLGWFMIRFLINPDLDLAHELSTHHLLYLYMLLGTVFVFSLFGFYTGLQEKRLEDLSITDHLSGLYNRRYFFNRLNEELHRTDRAKSPLSVISFDLDFFKRINDQFGHAAGDLVIENVGKASKHILRTEDIVGRLGGEEFSVLLPDCDMATALTIAKRLQQDIKSIRIPVGPDASIHVSASFGISTKTSHQDANELLKQADIALYQAKQNGRDCIVEFSNT